MQEIQEHDGTKTSNQSVNCSDECLYLLRQVKKVSPQVTKNKINIF